MYLNWHININKYLANLMNQSPFDQVLGSVESLIRKSKPSTSTPMKTVVAALYTADANGQFRYSNSIGLLSLDSDRLLKSTMLRFYSLETMALLLEVQLYYGFAQNYKMITGTFYAFEYVQGFVGFLFRSQLDAEVMGMKIKSMAPKMSDFQEIKHRKIQEAKEKKEEDSFFNRVKNFFGDKNQEPKKHSGEIISFEKGLSFDLKAGKFNSDDIPPAWKEIFGTLKLSDEDLNNKQIVNIIAEQTLFQQAKAQALQTQDYNLQAKIRQVEEEDKKYMQAYRQTVQRNLPPPPLPPPLLLAPPPLPQVRASMSSKRANLMDQIRNNKIKLNHISKTNQGGINLDISNMNKEERNDHAERLRVKLQMRKQALNRRQASDDED